MSRSNPTEVLRNPAEYWIKYHGASLDEKGGKFTYFDKEKGEKGEDITINLEEFEFIALEWKLLSVRGYSNRLEAYCYSNDVRTVHDPLIIRNFKSKKSAPSELLKGTYSQMKGDNGLLQGDSNTRELKYHRTVYLRWNRKLFGMHLSGQTFYDWSQNIERFEHTKMLTHFIRVKEIISATKGKVDYTYATFEFGGKIPDEEGAEATKTDFQLQDFLKKYLAKNGSQEVPGDTGGAEETLETLDSSEFNPDEWRLFRAGDTELGKMNLQSINGLLDACYEAGGRSAVTDKNYFDALVAARAEYDEAGKTWRDLVDSKNKKILEYTIDELKQMSKLLLEKQPHNPVRLKIEFAWEAKEKEEAAKKLEEASTIEPIF